MIRKFHYLALVIVSIAFSVNVFADIKIKSKQSMSGQSFENTTYIKGKRQRTETMNGMMITLTQCDLRRGVQINPNARTYMVNPFNTTIETSTRTAGGTTVEKNGVVQSGGTVTTTVTTKDTGERKQMFGYTARHLIITMETTATADACNKTKTKMETDGWYIDFEPQFDCGESASNGGGYGNYKKSGCQDKYVMKAVGTAKRGFPVYEKMTMFDEGGKETMSYVNEVVELSKATLDVGLFEIPEGYREVSDASQMYAAAVPSTSNSESGSSYGRTSSLSVLPNGAPSLSSNSILSGASTTPVKTSAIGPKKEGVLRIGIAAVKTGAVGDGVTAADLAVAVQNSLIEYLKVPNVEVVTLDAKLASAVEPEAKEKECDLVLYATASHKKGGGGFGGMFGSALGSAIATTGIGHTGSTVGNIAGQVATQSVVSAMTVSSKIKAKDELTLDVKLNRSSGEAALSRVFKVKAKGNGDDIISAAVEQAAQAVVDVVRK